MSRIEDGVRVITITRTDTYKIGICYSNCDGCGAETPTPTDAEVIEQIENYDGNYDGHFMWPFVNDGWIPDGWSNDRGTHTCPGCTDAINEVLAKRARSKS